MSSQRVAFGSWRCNCTMIGNEYEDILDKCPVHGVELLGPRSWADNTNNVPIGYSPPPEANPEQKT